jgi:hypothetical protein
VSAGFTARAGLSIITISIAEGPARNNALSIYSATGATGFSLGLVFSGALVLAVVTAVNSASAGLGGSPDALLDGFHAAIIVSLVVAALGVAATVLRRRGGGVPCPEPA